MMKKPAILLALLGAVFGIQVTAAESPAYAEIVFVEGGDLAILRADAPLGVTDPIGLRLLAGDQIQTGSRTSVELVMMPRRSRLRLSENTIVTIRDLGGNGSTGLELLYGRLRSKVEKVASGDAPYRVSSRSFIAGVRGTDFGCDVLVARPGEGSRTKVYCFEGSVEVKPPEPTAATEEGGEGGAEARTEFEAVLVSAGTMAIIEAPSAGKAVELVEKPIDAETTDFWKGNGFSAAQPSGASGVSAVEGKPSRVDGTQLDLRPARKALAAKNSMALGGTILVGMGLAMEGVSLLMRSGQASRADGFFIAGSITAALGLPIIIFSIPMDPLAGIGP
jgi:hypothetical protein